MRVAQRVDPYMILICLVGADLLDCPLIPVKDVLGFLLAGAQRLKALTTEH